MSEKIKLNGRDFEYDIVKCFTDAKCKVSENDCLIDIEYGDVCTWRKCLMNEHPGMNVKIVATNVRKKGRINCIADVYGLMRYDADVLEYGDVSRRDTKKARRKATKKGRVTKTKTVTDKVAMVTSEKCARALSGEIDARRIYDSKNYRLTGREFINELREKYNATICIQWLNADYTLNDDYFNIALDDIDGYMLLTGGEKVEKLSKFYGEKVMLLVVQDFNHGKDTLRLFDEYSRD